MTWKPIIPDSLGSITRPKVILKMSWIFILQSKCLLFQHWRKILKLWIVGFRVSLRVQFQIKCTSMWQLHCLWIQIVKIDGIVMMDILWKLSNIYINIKQVYLWKFIRIWTLVEYSLYWLVWTYGDWAVK